jgi:phosphoglycolate phosphatase
VILVVFDCDGTIVDSQHGIVAAMEFAFAAEGLPAPTRAAVLDVVGLSLPQAFDRVAAAYAPDMRARLADHYRDGFASARARADHTEPLFDGLADAVATLAARDDVLLGIATGKSQRGVHRLLDAHDWHGRFVTIQTADDNPSKPHPAMLLKACTEAGVAPDATVMIGDTTYDMAMAVNAGVGPIGVAWGYHTRDAIIGAGAKVVLDHGHEIVAAVDRYFEGNASR